MTGDGVSIWLRDLLSAITGSPPHKKKKKIQTQVIEEYIVSRSHTLTLMGEDLDLVELT